MKERIISCLVGAVAGGIATKTYMENKQKKKSIALRSQSEKHLKMFFLMNQWIENKQNGKVLEDYFIENGMRRIAIYGMSYIGQRLCEELQGSSVEIIYGIDKNTKEVYSTLNMYQPTDELPLVDAIIVTAFYFYRDIERELSRNTDMPIISIEEIVYGM